MLTPQVNQYLSEHSSPLSTFLFKLIQNTQEDLEESSHMLSGPLVSNLLKLLIKISKPTFILDLGTYTGFSALTMVEAMPQDSQIISCELIELHAKEAQKNFEKHPLGDKIKLFIGPVKKCLDSLETSPDFVFLDADKKDYLMYYEEVVSRMQPGGLFIIDDVLWKGKVVNPEKIREKRMDLLNKRILEDSRVENLLLPIRNGINLVYKL